MKQPAFETAGFESLALLLCALLLVATGVFLYAAVGLACMFGGNYLAAGDFGG